jgi:hypothetical protein
MDIFKIRNELVSTREYFMFKPTHKHLVVLLPLILAMCNAPNSPGVNLSGNGLYIEGANPVRTTIVGQISQSCPIGVICDQSFDYHAYAGTIDSIHFYFSFEPQWLNNKSLQGMRETFNYLYLSLYLHSRETDSVAYYYNLNAVWGSNVDSTDIYSSITGFRNDTLSGIIKVKFPYLTKRSFSRDSSCHTGDIAGLCFDQITEPAEYIISYNIKLVE